MSFGPWVVALSINRLEPMCSACKVFPVFPAGDLCPRCKWKETNLKITHSWTANEIIKAFAAVLFGIGISVFLWIVFHK